MNKDQQSSDAQKGEITFRKKLVQQQVEGTQVFNDEFDAKGIEQILSDRMKETKSRMTQLKESGIKISPYIEIGAERGQRSIVMENDMNASGAAVDISFDMLKSCEHYAKMFNKKYLPLRVCCDANTLPFLSNSLPFVFCYETLHHFPDPAPIIIEMHRVLMPGGVFFFDEEPYKKILHLNLYKAKKKYSDEYLSANIFKKLMDYFLADEICNETEHGVIENEQISIGKWNKALALFDKKEIELTSMKVIRTGLSGIRKMLLYPLVYLLGGVISGTCRKSGGGVAGGKDIMECLACPSCLESGQSSKLTQTGDGFTCSKGLHKFPVIDGVAFLFTDSKFKELYPELYRG
jgi:ubiquinone/menaquinone biosynthesis C-methylase UbiE/uncharacterized protein YbaR (Trm112 family)